ncbi:hypothetical protein DEO72_LG10g1388 [Vigna unguiculata]|uniref:Uncharacterized protein n=1 Tax=Vigna unguiculata TaxID=3917 RepID=A0A4D6NBB3_VIGUN|nr:hypothetical protein DEO72_LG10g1388 [Vigna unguiculata]
MEQFGTEAYNGAVAFLQLEPSFRPRFSKYLEPKRGIGPGSLKTGAKEGASIGFLSLSLSLARSLSLSRFLSSPTTASTASPATTTTASPSPPTSPSSSATSAAPSPSPPSTPPPPPPPQPSAILRQHLEPSQRSGNRSFAAAARLIHWQRAYSSPSLKSLMESGPGSSVEQAAVATTSWIANLATGDSTITTPFSPSNSAFFLSVTFIL